ncbi:MAG: tripartite tricarboxylate transporter TctB family protein [Desulfovibrio sp.]|jgi:putative tricarboxylic transport membrane protein|nr:tripartite tricarboxylate transporter TctB family protein [Desulfovibrio sp.]
MDLYIGLFFLLFTVVYIAQIPAIRMTRVSRIDSAMYPKMIAALLLCLSLAQIYVALKQLKLGGQAVREEQTKREYKGAARTLFLAVAYVVMMEDLGFLISSPIYIFLQILIMCPLEKVRYVQFGIIAIVASGIIYVIFRHGLNLMLPLGLLERLYY